MWNPVNIKDGVVRQSTPYDSPGYWWNTNNVRWVAGSMCPIGGNEKISPTPAASTIRRLFQWRDSASQTWVFAGCDQNAYLLTDALYDVTPSGFQGESDFTAGGYGVDDYGKGTYGTPRAINPPAFRNPHHWTVANFGQDIVAVMSSDGRLLHFSPTTGRIQPMDVPTNAPKGTTAVVVTAERAVMLLGADGNPRRVAWSDLENLNGWTFNKTTGQAGYLDLEATSPIVTGCRVKDGVLVLTQHEAFLVRYVGAPFFYGAEKIGVTTFAAPYALATAGNLVMWYGSETFWTYDGGAIQPLPCPMFSDLRQAIDPFYGVFRAHLSESADFPEFWFEYPSTGQTECDSAIVFNYADGLWFPTKRARTAACGALTANNPLAAGTDKNIYLHETGYTDNGASRVGSVWAESGVLQFQEGPAMKDVMQAMVAESDFDAGGKYQIKFLSRLTPGQADVTYGPYTPRSDGYMDCRATGRDLRMRIEATTDGYWSLGQIRLDIESDGGLR